MNPLTANTRPSTLTSNNTPQNKCHTQRCKNSPKISRHGPEPKPKSTFMRKRNIMDDAQPDIGCRPRAKTLEESRGHIPTKRDPTQSHTPTRQHSERCRKDKDDASSINLRQRSHEERTQGHSQTRDRRRPNNLIVRCVELGL